MAARVARQGIQCMNQWNPKYGCKGTVTTCFALIVLVAWQYSPDSTLRKLFVHPKYGWNGTVSMVFPLITLIALGAFFHSTPGSAQWRLWQGILQGKIIHWRGSVHLVNRRALRLEFVCRHPVPKSPLLRISGGPKGGHLKGGHLKMGFRSEARTRKWDFALQFALDTSLLTPLSKGIPQGRRRLDREGAV